VPTLLDGEQALYEAAAICMHLADRHSDKALAPTPGTAERALYYQWLLFLSTTLQTAFMRYYRPSRASADPAHEAAVKHKALKDVAEIWASLDRQLAGQSFLAGERFTGADIYFHMLNNWIWTWPRWAGAMSISPACSSGFMPARPLPGAPS
jgi:glutathione S-transferase